MSDVLPGLWWDEGRDDWAALNVVQGSPWHVYFVAANIGSEPLHIYLIALWFRLFGVHYLAGRWVSALTGALTVPALYWAALEWLSPHVGKPRARIVGLLAAALLATFFSHLLISRIGFEIVLAPAGSVLTMAALGRGLRTRRPGWFALAGLTLGLTLYTGPTGRAADRRRLGVRTPAARSRQAARCLAGPGAARGRCRGCIHAVGPVLHAIP